ELPAGQGKFTYMERGKDLNIDRIFFIGYYEGKNLSNVIILDFTRAKLVQIISAASGLWDNGHWTLNSGRTYVLSGDSDITRISRFDKMVIPGLGQVQKALSTGKVSPKK
ncbi:MAG: LptF/LptG family permease, partial [Candidatus Obscuribacterales bacterium]